MNSIVFADRLNSIKLELKVTYHNLGYGKIEPMTIKARMFTVVWGFIGVPFTVIILTNLGLYMRSGERYLRRRWCRKSDNQQNEKSHWLLSNSDVTDRETITDGDSSVKKSLGSRSTNMSPLLLATVVFLYLVNFSYNELL